MSTGRSSGGLVRGSYLARTIGLLAVLAACSDPDVPVPPVDARAETAVSDAQLAPLAADVADVTPFADGPDVAVQPPDAGVPLDAGVAVCDGSFFVGTWQRTDGFLFVFSAQGCAITGVGDTGAYTHRLSGTFDTVTGRLPFTIVRTTLLTGCVTALSGFIHGADASHLTLVLTGSDGACDLPSAYTEVQTYQHL